MTARVIPLQEEPGVVKVRIKNRATSLLVISTISLVVGSISVAMARPGPTVIEVQPPSTADDPTPPAAPPEKAAAAAEAQDMSRDSTLSETAHEHEDSEPSDASGNADWTNDPDAWVCVGPDDIGQIRIIRAPSESMLLAARDAVLAERAKDPSYMPTVEYAAAPDGCEPIDGKDTLEEFHLARSSAAVINPDGSVKSKTEIAADVEARP